MGKTVMPDDVVVIVSNIKQSSLISPTVAVAKKYVGLMNMSD